ncbi:hypothetical protein BDF20DRAFT_986628 [Mycotypha africana]|uniref:uncharacterized protein n=1 Tax=Mycotypha africana TaxID=64632 RepID=UPI002301433B|nr:uncharacterized protein BDF20DRAFT_986628 [Mycotypha africana]KAI8984788.1 hypothetical protein BDF20DRAFT_986628 [Mycotypha africana]
MVEVGEIYSAIYSGIPVFEMVVNGVAVMRRRNDSYMNATQILKVANIEKGKRTKILEKEVLTGTHEKVQGGYGKYQGTWIPYERSVELAEKYGVRDALAPLLFFEIDDINTPQRERVEGLLTKEQTKLAKKKLSAITGNAASVNRNRSNNSSTSGNAASAAAITPHSPIPQTYNPSDNPSSLHTTHDNHRSITSPARKKFKPATPVYDGQTIIASNSYQRQPSPLSSGHSMGNYSYQQQSQHMTKNTTTAMSDDDNSSNTHRSLLMSIFLSDKPDSILPYLNGQHQKQLQQQQNKDQPFNIDMVIDDQGNTALHWATSLARSETVKLLVGLGANIACTNYVGETPLMRGVMVVNNFDHHCFDEIFDLLKESLTVTDNKKRTALHHAAMTAGIQGRMHASVYYMKLMLDYIVSKIKPTVNMDQASAETATVDEDFRNILDAQDALGDTAYMVAAKLGCKPLMEMLEDAGATSTTTNLSELSVADHNDLRNAEIGETAKSTSDTPIQQQHHQQSNLSDFTRRSYAPSQRGKEIMATVQKIVDALDDEYGNQLAVKEQELQRILKDLEEVTSELDTTRKGLEERQQQSQQLAESQQKARHIETIIQNQYKELEWLMYHYGGTAENRDDEEKADIKKEPQNQSQRILPTLEEIESSINLNKDIDKLILGDDIDNPADQITVEEYIKKLRATITAYKKNDEALQHEIQNLQHEYMERELQCKRLIAACCNLPLEKIDDLVEPLTLAIESDPPDLDLARVIGFMEKIRRQGAFGDPPVATMTVPSSSATSSSMATENYTQPPQQQPSQSYATHLSTPNNLSTHADTTTTETPSS